MRDTCPRLNECVTNNPTMRLLFLLSTLLTLALAAPQAAILYQFKSAAQWIENLVVRPNGKLILTTFDRATVFSLDPNKQGSEPELIAQLPDSNMAAGIIQVAPDVYAIAGGTINRTAFTFEDGKICVINMKNCGPDGDGKLLPVRVAATLPDAKLLNGVTQLPDQPHIILAVDSLGSVIWRVNTVNGKVDVAIRDELLGPISGTPFLPVGVNGAQIRDGYLYFSNTSRQIYARVKITQFGDKDGDVEILTRLKDDHTLDDFQFANNGSAYIATPDDQIGRIDPDNSFHVFTSNPAFETITSVRLSSDNKMLYATTAGSDTGNQLGGQVFSYTLG